MAEKQIGKVTHFFDKAGVAVIKLSETLNSGDMIKVVKGDAEFEDAVSSMQIDHKPVSSAKAGDEVAVKLSKETKEGAVVFKVEG
ncbi:hypothetical protein HYT00_01225 [Candidatus Giovannonibacteria bacterium]|nr:hypothetical protein [Candidatus Giovannonibacteria bacterium]